MRLFVGVPVDCEDVLGPVRNTLRRLDGVRPVPEGSAHVTLRFLGDMDDAADVERAVGGALGMHHAMDAEVDKLGMFQDPRHARIVWAHVHADGLTALQEDVVEATADLGQPEASRQFVPHITLARCKHPQDLRGLLEEYPGPFWKGRIDRVVLYESHLSPEGPEYEALKTWRLPEP